MAMPRKIAEGQWTSTIYTMIAEGKHVEVIPLLEQQLEVFPMNRAALSLLGYCYYHLQAFPEAANCYERLLQAHPEATEYKLIHAQALFKAGSYTEAQKVALSVDDPKYQQRVLKLQAYIKYQQDELAATKARIDSCSQDDPDIIIAQGCLLFKEKKYEEARQRFTDALNTVGYKPSIAYNIALCYYYMKQFIQARKYIIEIIEKGIKEHPGL